MIPALLGFLEARLALLPLKLSAETLLTRDAPGGLHAPGLRSANGHCGLFRASDGWVALNLARAADVEMIPALTGRDEDPWTAVERAAAQARAREFVAWGVELQLPIAALGEARPAPLAGPSGAARGLRVLDLAALWAGPLCARLLALAGAVVSRIENAARPDPTPVASPALDRRLNAGKTRVTLDLSTADGRRELAREVAAADVVVTSARAGALAALGLDDRLLAARPRLLWAAITAHGWGEDRVGFGDDCAAAGGLVDWRDDAPRFVGDAIADPLTGLEAALAVLAAAAEGRGGRLEIAMAGVAAAYRARAA